MSSVFAQKSANGLRSLIQQVGGYAMRFGEKLRALRREKGLTQAELAKLAGVGLKTITNYEKGTTYPQNREVYGILARILGCDADYLHNEGDDFIAMAGQEYGYRGKKGAERLLREVRGAFSGGEMAEEDMDELMLAIQEAYIDAKKRNKKYTPKKYLKQDGTK
jgi:transcriptional regulator with XRE-family HTH domain